MGTAEPHNRVLKRILKSVLISVFSVIGILLVLFSGLLLGQTESLHDSGHSVINIALEENEPDISENVIIVGLDGINLEAVVTIPPVGVVNNKLQK